ncbi:MAG: amidohydrolase, partial [Bacillota bacterium]
MQLFKGQILTCDRNNTVHKYLVEDKGRIIHAGDQLPRAFMHSDKVYDLGEKALLPAFGDGHIHFSNWALFNSTFDVRNARSVEELGKIIQDYALKDNRSKVLFGFGMSRHILAEKRLVTRVELDRYVKNRPVYLVSYDGHSAVANSAALGLMPSEIRGLNGFNLESGQISYEAFYKATDHISGKFPLPTLLKFILKGTDTLAGYGVGMVHPVEGIGYPRDLDVDLVRFMARGSQVNFRTYFQTMDLKKIKKRKLPRVGGCFATALDGCFGVKDAALLEPYSDDPDNKGILFYSDEEVTEFVKEANRAELQVQLHCIGDAAVTQAVKAIEAALEDFPRRDHRHTLIHATLTPEPLLEKIAALEIGITLQPGFLTSPLEPFEYLEKILGDRAHQLSPLRKMLDMGIRINGGSDGPVTEPNPVQGIYGACNYNLPGQSVTIAE